MTCKYTVYDGIMYNTCRVYTLYILFNCFALRKKINTLYVMCRQVQPSAFMLADDALNHEMKCEDLPKLEVQSVVKCRLRYVQCLREVVSTFTKTTK